MHDAESYGFLKRRLETTDGHVGSRIDVLLEHFLVVHLVDVITREQHDELGPIALDDIYVLVDRIRGAEVPHRFGYALGRRQDVEALVPLWPEEVPAALQMANEAVGLVLRGDRDAPNAGFARVRQSELYDARLAAEIDRGLRASVGELEQSAAAAAGEHVGHGVARIG